MSSGLLRGSELVVEVPATVKSCVSEAPLRTVRAVRAPPRQPPGPGVAEAGEPAVTSASAHGVSAARAVTTMAGRGSVRINDLLDERGPART